MPYERSSGAIIFYLAPLGPEYLLLHRPPVTAKSKDAWDFSKGNVELKEKEKDIEAARREIEEETGISQLEFLPDFKEKIRIFYRRDAKSILKDIIFYLAKSHTKDVKISWEHDDFVWLPYKEALVRLSYNNSKALLRKAQNYLKKKFKDYATD